MVRAAVVAAAVLVLGSGAALAATVTESNPISFTADGEYSAYGYFPLDAPGFDPSLGTLTGETLTIAGNLTPGQEWWASGLYPPYPATVPVTLTTHLWLDPESEITLPTESVDAVQQDTGFNIGSRYAYVTDGTPESFSITAPVDVGGSYATIGGGPIEGHAWTAVGNFLAVPQDGSPDPTDIMQVQGTATAVFTYTPADPPADPPSVPEPASWMLLMAGVVGFVAVARRPSTRPRR